MDIITLYFVSFLVGTMFGVIDGINPKISWIIWILVVIYTFSNVVFFNQTLSYNQYGFSNWHWIGNIYTFALANLLSENYTKKMWRE